MTIAEAISRSVRHATEFLTTGTTPQESDRMARRRQIREKVAEGKITQARAEAVERQISDLEAGADRAADRHQETCKPLQSQLAVVEARIMRAMAARDPVAAGDEAERLTLLAKVGTANETLEREVQACKAMTEKLAIERDKLRMEAVYSLGQESRLLHVGIANPDLLDQMDVAKSSEKWAWARHKAALKQVKELESSLAVVGKIRQPVATLGGRGFAGEIEPVETNPELAAIYTAQLRRWKMELEIAELGKVATKKEIDRIYQKLIDE